MLGIGLKIHENLFFDGKRLFSYETHVATVEGKELRVKGVWSHTTSKHINRTARLLGLSVMFESKQRKEGYWFEMGVRCSGPGDCLSLKGSHQVIRQLHEQPEWEEPDLALAMFRAFPELGKKDRALVSSKLEVSPELSAEWRLLKELESTGLLQLLTP